MNELQRIQSLPKREYSESQVLSIVKEITDQLRSPTGTQTLRPHQAISLLETFNCKGLVGAIRVGGGKTLISLLIPTVLDSRRAVLLLPAALIGKTERDKAFYAKHWQVCKHLRLMSYEMLGRTQSAQWLENFAPDLIIADECHRLKNPRAAVTKRVARYMQAHPSTRFIGLSGTIVRKSIKDYVHIANWALKGGSPLPQNKGDIDSWADALDAKTNPLDRGNPELLAKLGGLEGYQDRLIKTPGIIITRGNDGCDAALNISALRYEIAPQTQEHFKRLRKTWTTPCGWMFADPMEAWRHARELALGLHYRWDPHPPREWLEARAAFASKARQIIIRSRKYDSEKQVIDAITAGHLDIPEYFEWARMRPTFVPNPVAVWHDTIALDVSQRWGSDVGGIVWTSHTFFAEELGKRTGWRYFGRGGVDKNGEPIEHSSPDKDKTVIASIPSNGTGRNLQAWSNSLVTAPLSSGEGWEQLLGRKHRDGQKADEVNFDVFFGCKEHAKSIDDALIDAEVISKREGMAQKLLLATRDFPPPPTQGWQWGNMEI